nr:hypothetical protein [Tanacetum cinerariifolium]
MTRSSTKKLFTPFKDPEREFRSSRKHFKTLSLNESRSHDFDLFFDQEEYSEEEVAKTMAETMEQYMSKTGADYESGIAKPKIEDKDSFELKGQFLKELRDKTFRGSDHEDANEHIKKVLEIMDLFHIPNITIDQVMLRAFTMSLTRAAIRWLRNKPSGLITTWEDMKIEFLSKYFPPACTAKKEVVLFYNGLDVPTRQILDSKGAMPSKTVADAKEEVAKTMAETIEQYMSKTRADYGSGIAKPKIEDKDSFELKGQFLKELRDNTFSGSDHEDANKHIEKVLEIVDLFHIPNIIIHQVILRAFPMSLTGAASHWLRNNPSGLITTWEDLKTKFLSKYCPPARTAKKMDKINNFQQEPDENLYQAWERFKELLMKCPQHYLT